MRCLKYLTMFLIVFILAGSFECGAVDKNQIIIGTAGVSKSSAYDYVTEALENGFYNIDTSIDYYNDQEVGQSIRDFERKSKDNHVYVISKFSLPDSFGDTVFINDSLVESVSDLEDVIKRKLEMSIKTLGHVDEFLFHKIIPRCVSLNDIVKAFRNIKESDEKYKNIKFGINTVSSKEINELINNGLGKHVEVIQNPYWYGSDFLVNLFDIGDKVYDVCQKYGIKYETYRTLGKGYFVKNLKLPPSLLVKHSVDKGYVPIVKATGRKHLEDLVKEVDKSVKLPQINIKDYYDSGVISENIQILNKGIVNDNDPDQLDVINSKQHWYRKESYKKARKFL